MKELNWSLLLLLLLPPQALKLLGLISFVRNIFTLLEHLKILYDSLIWSKNEYTSSLAIFYQTWRYAKEIWLYSWFDQFDFYSNCDFILECSNFSTHYSRRQLLDGLFVYNFLKGQQTAILTWIQSSHTPYVSWGLSLIEVSESIGYSPLVRCVSAVNSMCQLLYEYISNRSIAPLEDILYFWLNCYRSF